MQKWAEEQNKARQEEANQWWLPGPAQPAAIPPNQPAARPGAGLAPATPPAPKPTAKQPQTHTVAIDHGGQVTRTTFVLQDDGSWRLSEGPGTNTVTQAAPGAGPPFDREAFRQKVLQNQERVRQRILQSQQQMMQRLGR
jgi:hypothetical protein